MCLRDVAHLFRRHDPRPKGAGMVKILARNELRGMPLPLADRAIIIAGVSGDDTLPVRFCNMSAAAADDHRQLTLVVERRGSLRTDHGLAVPNLGAGVTGKDDWLWRYLAPTLLDMGHVVQSDAEN